MRKVKLREGTNTAVLFGHHDRNLKLLEDEFDVRLSARGEELSIDGPSEASRQVERVIGELAALANEGFDLTAEDVTHVLAALRREPDASIKEILFNSAPIVTKKRFIVPKTPTQRRYIDAIEKYDVVIAIGPADTGKTYLAMAMAVSGVCSAGFTTTVQPAASAAPTLRAIIAAGKFQGVITAQTPTGSFVTMRRRLG